MVQIQQVFTKANFLTQSLSTLKALHSPSFLLSHYLSLLSSYLHSLPVCKIRCKWHQVPLWMHISLSFKTDNEDPFFGSPDSRANNGKNAEEIIWRKKKKHFLICIHTRIYVHTYMLLYHFSHYILCNTDSVLKQENIIARLWYKTFIFWLATVINRFKCSFPEA